MIQRRLFAELEKVARRFRRLRLFGILAANWAIAALVGACLTWMAWDSARLSPWTAAWLAGAFLISGAVAGWLAIRSVRGMHWLARRIEAHHPALQSRLVTAVEQAPDASGRFGYLQETVIREALEHGRRYRWENTVSDGRLTATQIAHFAALASFAGVVLALAAVTTLREAPIAAAAASDIALVEVGRYRIEVKPGDAEIERGTSLVVVARFEGELPAEATLLVDSSAGKSESLPMSRSLDDPLYGGRLAAVNEGLTYRVAFDDQQTRDFRVTVFEHPALMQADARLAFPEYTSMEEKLVEDTRRVSAVEGTQLTWVLRLNKPIAEGRLESGAGDVLPLTGDETAENVYTASLTMEETRRYRLHLKDEQGRTNKEPPELVVNVLPNRPPEIEIAWPSRDSQVSPLEEFDLEAAAWDDFGVSRYGLSYSHAGGEPQEIILGEGGGPKERRPMIHQINFEELGAEPDQLLSYYFFAEDVGPDGEPRRTWSDMFFAEVRPFEQIFRQAEQPPGGQQQQQQQQAGQNAQQAEQLAELQKQIIAATWNVIRRERPGRLTSQLTPDARLLVESQSTAMEQLEELAGEVQDPQSQAHVEEVKQHMVSAIQHLMKAVDETSPEPLNQALPEEQAAYQALLKLRAREHQVMRSNSQQQQGGGGGGGGAMQQQLNELELKDDENRYETQRTAQSQQEQQQQEVRQAVNRLRELARRQEDLNKQLQELQTALEQAETEEEREEIRRRLERLREEQQQILRDIDNLQERMNEPQNQREMAQEQQRLAETRENVRQASEALEQGMVSQALAEGTRAQREFEELRDEFRRRAAGQFEEEMREMRDAARQLEERERRLAEQLQEPRRDEQRRSLRESSNQEEIARGFQEQREELQDLLQRMEQVVQEAEQPEPLLADQLYDTLRRARQEPIENALDTARQLAEAGLMDQAGLAEEVAGRGIENIRQGVERAAESVLGDEAEALARAHETLSDLTEQLEQEAGARNQESANEEPGKRRGSPRAEPNEQESGVRSQETANAESGKRRGSPRAESGNADQESEPQNGGDPNRPPAEQQQGGQSQQDGQQQQSGQSQQDGQQQQGGRSQQDSESQERQQGQQGQQNGEGQPRDSQESGQRGQPSPAGGARSLRDEPRDGQRPGDPNAPQRDRGGFSNAFDHQGGPMNPLTGENFREWSDRMRDVEEMLEDPELRGEAARIRDRARGMRAEFRRHSQEPNWDLVKLDVIKPLNDLRNRVAEELIRRQSKDALTPIDRDPVPPQFANPVRRYYEELGRGE